MRLLTLTAVLLSLLPPLAWGGALTTTLYRQVTVPDAAQLHGIYAGLRHCQPRQMLPRPVFKPQGLPFHGDVPALEDGVRYALRHPVSMGQRLLLTEVSRQDSHYQLRFNKSLRVYASQLPQDLQAVMADAGLTGIAVSADGRQLTCRPAGR